MTVVWLLLEWWDRVEAVKGQNFVEMVEEWGGEIAGELDLAAMVNLLLFLKPSTPFISSGIHNQKSREIYRWPQN